MGTPTYEDVYRPENKGAGARVRRLLQYCQSPDKISRDILTDLRNCFTVFHNFLCIYCTISYEISNNVLCNHGSDHYVRRYEICHFLFLIYSLI